MPIGEIVRIVLYSIPGLEQIIGITEDKTSTHIMMKIRFPRVLLALLVGAALGVADTAF